MKYTIDTDRKVVTVQGTVNIVELTDELKKRLGKEYFDYSIESMVEYVSAPLYQGFQPFTHDHTITCKDNQTVA